MYHQVVCVVGVVLFCGVRDCVCCVMVCCGVCGVLFDVVVICINCGVYNVAFNDELLGAY